MKIVRRSFFMYVSVYAIWMQRMSCTSSIYITMDDEEDMRSQQAGMAPTYDARAAAVKRQQQDIVLARRRARPSGAPDIAIIIDDDIFTSSIAVVGMLSIRRQRSTACS